MPLKHFTETFLVVVLGAVIALTGLLMATLPPLPAGALPWAVLFVLSIIYPLSLYSMFQKRRADNTFRNLHWFPACMLLVWVLLQAVTFASTLTTDDVAVYTWGWSIGVVVVGFVFLVMYCLNVIRRRVPRLAFLALILVPFAALAFVSESEGAYEKELAAVLWGADFWELKESGLIAGLFSGDSQSGKNLDASEDPSEEEWRERLRAQQEREKRLAELREQNSSEMSESSSSSSSSSSSQVVITSVSSKPSKLPDSGMSWTLIISFMLIAYSAVLHDRARRQIEN